MSKNSAFELLWMLCIKYREILDKECVWQIDTLLDIVWHDYMVWRKHGTFVSEEDITQRNPGTLEMLLEELRLAYERLENIGISRDMARQMLWEREPVSRVVIRQNYIVALVDLSIEIKLSPLQWSLYVLFIRHEEGIAYKQMPDYRDELIDIMSHNHCNGKLVNMWRFRNMVWRLTDPSRGAMNENVSRIRRAFCNAIGSDDAARHYYICGTRNSRHRIALSREYVLMEC